MTLSIDLTEPTLAVLQAEATRRGQTVELIAVEHLAKTEVADVDWDAVGISDGAAEVHVGHSRLLEEFQAERRVFRQGQP